MTHPAEHTIRKLGHLTLLDEHFRIKGREKWYEFVAEMQNDLDGYLHTYNHDRTHQRRGMAERLTKSSWVDF